MMRQKFRGFLVFIFFAALAFLAGCATQESHFYILESMRADSVLTESRTSESDLAIGVGPVELSAHLERPHIVIRDGGSEVFFSEFDRWAEPLKENISRVLSENLSILLSTGKVVEFPWKSYTPVDYRVELFLLRFDASSDGSAVLIANWSIFEGKGREALLKKRSVIRSTAIAEDYGGKVSAMNKTLSELSREIAAEFRWLSTRN